MAIEIDFNDEWFVGKSFYNEIKRFIPYIDKILDCGNNQDGITIYDFRLINHIWLYADSTDSDDLSVIENDSYYSGEYHMYEGSDEIMTKLTDLGFFAVDSMVRLEWVYSQLISAKLKKFLDE